MKTHDRLSGSNEGTCATKARSSSPRRATSDGAGDPGGRHSRNVLPPYQSAAGPIIPRTPTIRRAPAALGSSYGGVESGDVQSRQENRASYRGPANHKAVALICPQ
jgi:hypothetical protein